MDHLQIFMFLARLLNQISLPSSSTFAQSWAVFPYRLFDEVHLWRPVSCRPHFSPGLISSREAELRVFSSSACRPAMLKFSRCRTVTLKSISGELWRSHDVYWIVSCLSVRGRSSVFFFWLHNSLFYKRSALVDGKSSDLAFSPPASPKTHFRCSFLRFSRFLNIKNFFTVLNPVYNLSD